MIRVLVKKQSGKLAGFHIEGHSGYAAGGEDIVCAAVSALAINCVNSVEEFTGDKFQLEQDEARGMMDFSISGDISAGAELLLKSMVYGLQNISETYGSRFVTVII